jgi:hypothetical protein
MALLLAIEMSHTLESEIVALRCSRGEDHFLGFRLEQGCYMLFSRTKGA